MMSAKFSVALFFGAALFAQASSLAEIHKIYVVSMPNDLDQYVRAEFYKQMRGELIIVTDKSDADAVLGGVSESKNGLLDEVTGKYLNLHDTATGSLNLYDKTGKTILWSGEAGDRSLVFGTFRRGGERKVAERLVKDLKKQIQSDKKHSI